MKVVNWIGHPVIFLICYLLLIIEGDHFGGFFMLYLLLTLPHFVPYAVIAALGMAGVIIGFNVRKKKNLKSKPLLYLIGFCFMVAALVIFFGKGNKWETFHYALPTTSFLLFGISSFCFLVNIVCLSINARSLKEVRAASSE